MKKAARSDVFLEGAAFFCGRGACFAAGRAGQSEFGFFGCVMKMLDKCKKRA